MKNKKTQTMLRIEQTREEKRLKLQNVECWTGLVYSPSFLDNKWYGKRMLDVCQTIVTDDLIKRKRRT